MVKDKYINSYLKALKGCATDKQRSTILNRIYEDGFQDGIEEG